MPVLTGQQPKVSSVRSVAAPWWADATSVVMDAAGVASGVAAAHQMAQTVTDDDIDLSHLSPALIGGALASGVVGAVGMRAAPRVLAPLADRVSDMIASQGIGRAARQLDKARATLKELPVDDIHRRLQVGAEIAGLSEAVSPANREAVLEATRQELSGGIAQAMAVVAMAPVATIAGDVGTDLGTAYGEEMDPTWGDRAARAFGAQRGFDRYKLGSVQGLARGMVYWDVGGGAQYAGVDQEYEAFLEHRRRLREAAMRLAQQAYTRQRAYADVPGPPAPPVGPNQRALAMSRATAPPAPRFHAGGDRPSGPTQMHDPRGM